MIKKVIIDSEKLNFVSGSIIYKDNNVDIVLAKSPSMNCTSNQISVKYHWFRYHVGKEFVIWKIESEKQTADIFTNGLQDELCVRIGNLLCGW